MSNSILVSSAAPAIEFRNVSISFDDVRALQNVSFSLGKGEMICLTGDSQSGKSVLLRLALLKPRTPAEPPRAGTACSAR